MVILRLQMIKLDSEDNILWETTLTQGNNDNGHSVKQTEDAGFTVGGRKGGNALMVRTNPFGNRIWNKRFGLGGVAIGSAVEQRLDGGFILVGQKTAGARTTNSDVFLFFVSDN